MVTVGRGYFHEAPGHSTQNGLLPLYTAIPFPDSRDPVGLDQSPALSTFPLQLNNTMIVSRGVLDAHLWLPLWLEFALCSLKGQVWLIIQGRKCERDIVVSDEVTVPFLDVVATRKWLGHAVVLRAASGAVDMAKVEWP